MQVIYNMQNIVATYIGVALYALLYAGYSLYEFFWLRNSTHLVPLVDVDLDTDAVWAPGEGRTLRQLEREQAELKDLQERPSRVRRALKAIGSRFC